MAAAPPSRRAVITSSPAYGGAIPTPATPAVAQATAAAIDAKLAGSPMAGTGATFVSAGNAGGISPWFLVAIAKVESQFGTRGFATNGSHNPFGLGVTGAAGAGFRYPTWDAAIRAAAANLAGPLYKGAGKVTIRDIGARWAADPAWATKVASAYAGLTGTRVLTTEIVIGGGRNLPQADPNTTPLDALGNLADATGIGGLVSLLARLFDPSTWLRFAGVIGGGVVIVVALLVVFRTQLSRRSRGPSSS